MSLPAITVVVPALNAAEWIGATLESVFAQTYPKNRLEIVVVDDASTDGTAAEADRLLAPSGIAHSVLRSAFSQGPSAARNRGWRHGRGEWIQFLDADDLLASSKIDVQARAASTVALDVAAVFSPWARLVLDHGAWVQQFPWTEPHVGADPLLDVLRTENFMQLGCLLFSRTWVERVSGFEESYRLIEDVDFLMRLVIAGGALYRASSGEPLSWYRQRAGSLSRSGEQAFIDGCIRNARMADRFWRERHELTAERASLIADVYFMGTRYYAGRDNNHFLALTRDIYRLKPGFIPRYPPSLRLLARILGYTLAERCAVQYRRVKRTLREPQVRDRTLQPAPERSTKP